MTGSSETPQKSGLWVFLVLAAILSIIALAAFAATGPVGIEDRFSSAVGLHTGDEAGHAGGEEYVPIEGSPVIYLLVLVILVVICVYLYRKYRF